jgi:hypothetical protein
LGAATGFATGMAPGADLSGDASRQAGLYQECYHMGILYPFQTKAAIKSLILSDVSFAMECAQIMTARQTDYEQSSKQTVVKNRSGWMSSHAVFGTKMTDKLASGETLEPNETARLQEMVSHYGKQLAAHFRQEAITNNPELKAVAEVFSAG